MITRLNRETNAQQEFFEAQQALSHAGIAFRTEVQDNTRRLLERQDLMGIHMQYPREYSVYVHKDDAALARHILQNKDNR